MIFRSDYVYELFRLSLQVVRTSPYSIFPTWEQFIPNVGTFHSQGGNKPFPCWEQMQEATYYHFSRINIWRNEELCVPLHHIMQLVMDKSKVIDSIKQVAERVLPKGSLLYLYGSRARGDWHDGSDWDLLLILDKPRLEHEDFNKYSYPFVEMGWDIGEDIRPHAYTKQEWFDGPHAMFYYNVEEDKQVLYGAK